MVRHSPCPCAPPTQIAVYNVKMLCCLRSGSPLDQLVPPDKAAEAARSHKLSAAAEHYLLVDTNVALHQVSVWVSRPGSGGTVGCGGRVSFFLGQPAKGHHSGHHSSGQNFRLLTCCCKNIN